MLASLYLSFTDYSLIQAPQWIGLENYVRMLGDDRLHHSLKVTFIYVFVSVPLQLIFALAIALLLDKGMRGLLIYRSIFYLPSMLGCSVAIALLWRQMFGTDGLVNQILRLFGFEATIGWISDPQLRAVDDHLAARVDVRVADGDLPGRSAADPGHVLRGGVGGRGDPVDEVHQDHPAAAVADHLLQPGAAADRCVPVLHPGLRGVGWTGGPADSTLFYSLYLYQRGFGQFQMGYAAAMAWLLVVIVGALTAVNFFLSKYWVFYDD